MNEVLENPSSGEASKTVSAETKEENRFIRYLKNLERRQDRAALAHLRRGLGKQPKIAMEMYPYLGQFLSHETKPRYENAVFIVAALFAYYPDAHGNVGNLGASLRQLKDDSDSIERRFVALLNAEVEELPYYLRQVVGLLRSKEIAVNWQTLFEDIQKWSYNDRRVQREWARSFWGNFYKDKKQETENNSGGEN
jgi:CRISPR system Cascade subunit CasB